MPASDSLIVYFSRSGHTKDLADLLAAHMSAAIEPCLRPPDGSEWPMGALVLRAMFRRPVDPAPISHDPSSFRILLVATPLWMGRAVPPVRGFLARNAGRFPLLAFAVSAGRCSGGPAFADMGRLAGATPVATLCVDDADRLSGRREAKVQAFADRVERTRVAC